MSTRPGHTIARTNKGHPRRQARRDRAAERMAQHEHKWERWSIDDNGNRRELEVCTAHRVPAVKL